MRQWGENEFEKIKKFEKNVQRCEIGWDKSEKKTLICTKSETQGVMFTFLPINTLVNYKEKGSVKFYG